MAGVDYVFGAGYVDRGFAFGDATSLGDLLTILEDGGCKAIDSASLYGTSEELLGKALAGTKFTIDTKTRGGFGGPGGAARDVIWEDAKNSRESLGCTVDVYYIHAPDEATALEDTLEGINQVYKTGFFRRFGLSNYKAEDVVRVYECCKARGYPLPTVYQGNYSCIARRAEDILFPTLRRLGIAFYAYSPLAGGFLTKTRQDLAENKGRFDKTRPLGKLYADLYERPSLVNAIDQWRQIAKDEGVPTAEMAYRWVAYNSLLDRAHGDKIILGASSTQQAKETIQSVKKGPLSIETVERIDEMWKSIEHEAPLDNFNK